MAAATAERWPSAMVPVGSSNPPPGMPITWVRFHALTVWTLLVCADAVSANKHKAMSVFLIPR